MRRNRGGFTILEVMIFLAISGMMLAAVMVAINGQQNRTEFIQGMRDIDSKLQDVLNDVSTGNFSYNDRDCSISSGRPAFTGVVGKQIGTRSNCLFLGEALQFSTAPTDNTKFAIYTVLGRRLMPDPVTGAPISVGSFSDANPTAMSGVGGPQNLTTYYNFEQGITARALHYNNTVPAGSYSLLGLYTSFNSAASGSTDSAQSLQPYIYKLPDRSNYDTNGANSAKKCIDDNNPVSPTCPFDTTLTANATTGFGICFDSNNGTGQTALITIYSGVQGVSTRLEYNPAAASC